MNFSLTNFCLKNKCDIKHKSAYMFNFYVNLYDSCVMLII